MQIFFHYFSSQKHASQIQSNLTLLSVQHDIVVGATAVPCDQHESVAETWRNIHIGNIAKKEKTLEEAIALTFNFELDNTVRNLPLMQVNNRLNATSNPRHGKPSNTPS
jgi:hypothetical protein